MKLKTTLMTGAAAIMALNQMERVALIAARQRHDRRRQRGEAVGAGLGGQLGGRDVVRRLDAVQPGRARATGRIGQRRDREHTRDGAGRRAQRREAQAAVAAH